MPFFSRYTTHIHRFDHNSPSDEGISFDLLFFFNSMFISRFQERHVVYVWGWMRSIFLDGFHRKNVNDAFPMKMSFHDVMTKYRNEIIKFPFNKLKSGREMMYIKCM